MEGHLQSLSKCCFIHSYSFLFTGTSKRKPYFNFFSFDNNLWDILLSNTTPIIQRGAHKRNYDHNEEKNLWELASA